MRAPGSYTRQWYAASQRILCRTGRFQQSLGAASGEAAHRRHIAGFLLQHYSQKEAKRVFPLLYVGAWLLTVSILDNLFVTERCTEWDTATKYVVYTHAG
jgi:hypothetical protein